jgi:sodium-dependent dicarboxylate transporter 2/3/5
MADNDSRWWALKNYRPRQLRHLFNTSTFLGNFVIAGILAYFLAFTGQGPAINYVFFLLLLSVGLWLTEAIPPFAVGIFIIAYLVFVLGSDYFIPEPLDVTHYVSTWTSDVIWLLLGGFFLAQGMKSVGLDRDLFRFALRRFGKKPQALLMGLMLLTALASAIMSNTATTAMMISSVLPLLRSRPKGDPLSRTLLIGIPAAASAGGMATIIGTAPNAIAVAALKDQGVELGFATWMAFGIPLAALFTYGFARYLGHRFLSGAAGIDSQDSIQLLDDSKIQVPFPARRERTIVLLTFAVTILLWSTEQLHGIPLAATSAVPIVMLTLSRIISAEEVRGLPWDSLMLVAGGLALGRALVDVGLAAEVLQKIEHFQIPLGFLAFSLLVIALILSNIMSHTAASAMIIPLVSSLPAPYGVALPIAIALTTSCALFLPVSTPPNAIAYSTGMMEQKDFRISGSFFSILGPPLFFGVSILVSILLAS